MLDRLTPPPFRKVQNVTLPRLEKETLANGCPLYFAQAGKQPVVSLHLVFEAGKRYEARPATAGLTAQMLTEGTNERSSTQISEAFERYGASFRAVAGAQRLTLELTCLTRFSADLTGLLIELLTESTFPQEDFDRLRSLAEQRLLVEAQQTRSEAGKAFMEALFGKGHPYGYRTDAEALRAVERKDLLRHYQAYILGRPFSAYLVGQPDEYGLQRIRDGLGQLVSQAPAAGLPDLPAPAPDQTLVRYDEWESASQTSLRMGKHLFNRSHPDYPDFMVLNEALGGYFGSRLMSNIREDKGYTYGIYSAPVSLPGAGYFVVSADVQKATKDESVAEIRKEIARLREEPIPADELEIVQNAMTGSFVKQLETPFAAIPLLKNVHFYDLPADYYESYIERVYRTDAARLQALANEHLSGDLHQVLVG